MMPMALASPIAAGVQAVQTAGAKSANGALGLVFVLFLAVALAFLLRSMNKHLRKVQRMKLEDQARDRDSDS
jgi:hypothetical protein